MAERTADWPTGVVWYRQGDFWVRVDYGEARSITRYVVGGKVPDSHFNRISKDTLNSWEDAARRGLAQVTRADDPFMPKCQVWLGEFDDPSQVEGIPQEEGR